jgi:hypothetical protein
MNKKMYEKFELLSLEMELLKTCTTDLGFFQRFVTRTIPLIRTLFPNLVQNWEMDLLTNSKVVKAIKELVNAFFSIWEVASKKQDIRLKKQLIDLLRRVRGPRFELGNPLIRGVYPWIKELYITHVLLRAKFSFAVKAMEIIGFDYTWKKHYSDCSMWWFVWNTEYRKVDFFYSEEDVFRLENSEEIEPNKRKQHKYLPGKIFSVSVESVLSRKINLISRCVGYPLKIVLSEEKFLKNRGKVFVHYSERRILRELDLKFAPTAKEIYSYPSNQYIVDQQCDPKFIWARFQTLEECWLLRNVNIFNMRWPRIRGSAEDVALLAHGTYNKFLLIAAAEELADLDKSKFKHNNFIREEYTAFLARLCLEIRILSILPDNKLNNNVIPTDLIPPKIGSDEEVFCEWYVAWLQKQKDINSHRKSHTVAIRDFMKSGVKLKKKMADSTYKTWIRNYRKRKRALLGKRIDHVSPKEGAKGAWVN